MQLISQEQLNRKLKAEEDQKRYDTYRELGDRAIWERFRILPVVSSLAATLLVAATFNQELLPLNFLVKVLLAILLMLIPVSLFGFLKELENSENHAFDNMENIMTEYGNEKIVNTIKEKRSKATFLGYLPWVVTVILSGIILVIVILIFDPAFIL